MSAAEVMQAFVQLLANELLKSRFSESLLETCNAICFNPKSDFHQNFFQMSQEQMNEYSPGSEHHGDAT